MGQNFHEFRECEAISEILPLRNSIFQNTAKISDVIVGSRINAICVDTLSGTAAVSSILCSISSLSTFSAFIIHSVFWKKSQFVCLFASRKLVLIISLFTYFKRSDPAHLKVLP